MSKNTLIVYQTDDGAIALKTDAEQETVWATQKQLAEVFGVDVRTINEHIKNIFQTGELEEKPTIRKFRIVQKEGKHEVARNIGHYNLDMMISVGYRVNSITATKFRKCATNLTYRALKQHITQGYTINVKQWLVIPAKAGIHHITSLYRQLDSRLRGNDKWLGDGTKSKKALQKAGIDFKGKHRRGRSCACPVITIRHDLKGNHKGLPLQEVFNHA